MAFKITIEKVDNALTCETGRVATGSSSGDIVDQSLPITAIIKEDITLTTLRKLLTLCSNPAYASVNNVTLTVDSEYASQYN